MPAASSLALGERFARLGVPSARAQGLRRLEERVGLRRGVGGLRARGGWPRGARPRAQPAACRLTLALRTRSRRWSSAALRARRRVALDEASRSTPRGAATGAAGLRRSQRDHGRGSARELHGTSQGRRWAPLLERARRGKPSSDAGADAGGATAGVSRATGAAEAMTGRTRLPRGLYALARGRSEDVARQQATPSLAGAPSVERRGQVVARARGRRPRSPRRRRRLPPARSDARTRGTRRAEDERRRRGEREDVDDGREARRREGSSPRDGGTVARTRQRRRGEGVAARDAGDWLRRRGRRLGLARPGRRRARIEHARGTSSWTSASSTRRPPFATRAPLPSLRRGEPPPSRGRGGWPGSRARAGRTRRAEERASRSGRRRSRRHRHVGTARAPPRPPPRPRSASTGRPRSVTLRAPPARPHPTREGEALPPRRPRGRASRRARRPARPSDRRAPPRSRTGTVDMNEHAGAEVPHRLPPAVRSELEPQVPVAIPDRLDRRARRDEQDRRPRRDGARGRGEGREQAHLAEHRPALEPGKRADAPARRPAPARDPDLAAGDHVQIRRSRGPPRRRGSPPGP